MKMKTGSRILLALVLGGLALIAGAFLGFRGRGLQSKTGVLLPGVKPVAKGFAVVELFTSEGCSSCPPADELVAAVQKEDKDLPVYVLAFHVDYWDRLGWKDTYSDAAYSERQKDYARWLQLSSIYTPQIVVNGQTEFVGSDARALRQAIASGLQEPGRMQLTLAAVQLNGSDLNWQASATPAAWMKDMRLFVAVVERDGTTKVMAGENSGKTLSHVQIVRGLATGELDAKGNAAGRLSWPDGLKSTDGEVIAFLQDIGTGKIVAATKERVTDR